MDPFTIENDPVAPWDMPKEELQKIAMDLLAIVKNDQAEESERIRAAEQLSSLNYMNDEAAETLLAIVQSNAQSLNLRNAAVQSLAQGLYFMATFELTKPEDHLLSEETLKHIQNTLREIHIDKNVPASLRRNALWTAVRLPTEWQLDAIRAAYSRSEGTWKSLAVFCMRFVPGFEEEIIESLDSPIREVRYHAILAAGEMEVKGAWAHIVALIASRTTPKALRLAAIETVAGICPEKAREVLGDLMGSKDGDIAEAASEEIHLADAIMEGGPSDEEADEEDGETNVTTIPWKH